VEQFAKVIDAPPITMNTKPAMIKHTNAELAAAFRKAMTGVFSNMEANAKRVEAQRKARIAAVNCSR
jgi:hypothetical protein